MTFIETTIVDNKSESYYYYHTRDNVIFNIGKANLDNKGRKLNAEALKANSIKIVSKIGGEETTTYIDLTYLIKCGDIIDSNNKIHPYGYDNDKTLVDKFKDEYIAQLIDKITINGGYDVDEIINEMPFIFKGGKQTFTTSDCKIREILSITPQITINKVNLIDEIKKYAEEQGEKTVNEILQKSNIVNATVTVTIS